MFGLCHIFMLTFTAMMWWCTLIILLSVQSFNQMGHTEQLLEAEHTSVCADADFATIKSVV